VPESEARICMPCVPRLQHVVKCAASSDTRSASFGRFESTKVGLSMTENDTCDLIF
jgi:hypothetical protein